MASFVTQTQAKQASNPAHNESKDTNDLQTGQTPENQNISRKKKLQIEDFQQLKTALTRLDRDSKILKGKFNQITNMKNRTFKRSISNDSTKQNGLEIRKRQYRRALKLLEHKRHQYEIQLLDSYTKIIEKQRKQIQKIPEELASQKFKNGLMKMRQNIMHRTVQVDLLKMRRTEWTTQKLMQQAASQQKQQRLQSSEIGSDIYNVKAGSAQWGKRGTSIPIKDTNPKKIQLQKTSID